MRHTISYRKPEMVDVVDDVDDVDVDVDCVGGVGGVDDDPLTVLLSSLTMQLKIHIYCLCLTILCILHCIRVA